MGSIFRFSLLFALGIFFFWGCASREYFQPLEVAGDKPSSGNLSSNMIDTSKYGATLKDGEVLTQDGLGFSLQKDEIFVGYSQKNYIVSRHCNTLLIYAQDRTLKNTLEIPSCPVSASISGDKIALVGNDNTIFLYEISTQKEIFSKKSNSAIAVTSVLQAPIFFEDYVFFPTLDGDVSIVNLKNLEVERSLVIDSAPFFNNVIFLNVQKDFILTATNRRILSVYRGNTYTSDEEVRDIKIHQDKIYISTLDGQIKEFDFTLKLLRSLKFQFASLPLINIVGDKLYTIEDGSGFLIQIDLKTFLPLVYKIKISRGENIFSQSNRLYYQDQFWEF